jgi:hypothetical protein
MYRDELDPGVDLPTKVCSSVGSAPTYLGEAVSGLRLPVRVRVDYRSYRPARSLSEGLLPTGRKTLVQPGAAQASVQVLVAVPFGAEVTWHSLRTLLPSLPLGIELARRSKILPTVHSQRDFADAAASAQACICPLPLLWFCGALAAGWQGPRRLHAHTIALRGLSHDLAD